MRRISARVVVGVLVVAFGVIASLSAQTSGAGWSVVQAIAAGREVRIVTDSRTVQGTLEQATDAALVLTTSAGQETVDRAQISVVSVRRESRRKRNALIGLGIGAGAGVGLGAAAGHDSLIPQGAAAVVVGAIGALVGTVTGGPMPTGGWREVYRK